MSDSEPPTTETVRVAITGQGIEFAREVPIALLPRLLALIVGPADNVSETTNTLHTTMVDIQRAQPDVAGLERPVGVAEFVRDKRPQTSSDTILVLAAYLELHEHRRPFSRDDLRRLMRIARLPEPANFPRDLGVAVGKGYIQPLEDGFQLTNSGLEMVGQPGPLVSPRGRPSHPRRAGRAREEEN